MKKVAEPKAELMEILVERIVRICQNKARIERSDGANEFWDISSKHMSDGSPGEIRGTNRMSLVSVAFIRSFSVT